MPNEAVELDERARVEQLLEPLACEELAALALASCAAAASSTLRAFFGCGFCFMPTTTMSFAAIAFCTSRTMPA